MIMISVLKNQQLNSIFFLAVMFVIRSESLENVGKRFKLSQKEPETGISTRWRVTVLCSNRKKLLLRELSPINNRRRQLFQQPPTDITDLHTTIPRGCHHVLNRVEGAARPQFLATGTPYVTNPPAATLAVTKHKTAELTSDIKVREAVRYSFR